MIKPILGIFTALLVAGCTVEPEVGSISDETTIETSNQNIAASKSDTYTYFLIPTRILLDAEYDELRNNLENFYLSEATLKTRAFEAAVGLIGDLLDKKYGAIVAAEILPSSQVVIIKTDREIDLTILEGLIEDVNPDVN